MDKKKDFKNHLSNLVAVAFIFGGAAMPKPYIEELPKPKQSESSLIADGAKMTFAAAVAIKVKGVGLMLMLRKTGELVGLLKGIQNILQEDLLLDTDDMPEMFSISSHVRKGSDFASGSGNSAPAAGSADRGSSIRSTESTRRETMSSAPLENTSTREGLGSAPVLLIKNIFTFISVNEYKAIAYIS